MRTTQTLLEKAGASSLAHRHLSPSERRLVARLVTEGKLVVSKPARFIYYHLPK